MANAKVKTFLDHLLDVFSLGQRALVVDSPPGAGKTLLIEVSAAYLASSGGLSVAVAMPGHEQCLAFTRRFLANHPEIAVQLWCAEDRRLPADLSRIAHRRGKGSYGFGPADGSYIQVGTISKLGMLKNSVGPFDVCFVDEAYQVTFSNYAPLLERADIHVFVGDPGQLAPTVRIDTTSFETLPFRPHLPVPLEMARHESGMRRLKLLQTYRFPPDTASLLQALYPELPFNSALSAQERRIQFRKPATHGDGLDQALDRIEAGASLVALTLPATMEPSGPDDRELLGLVAEVGTRLIRREPLLPDGTVAGARNIGCVEPHVAAGEAIRRQFAVKLGGSRAALVGTPEVWQGLQRPFVITRHPVGRFPSSFDLDPGRLCVALSRHQYGCIVVARESVADHLHAFQPDVGQRPLGVTDRVWHGAKAHITFWDAMHAQGRIFPVG